MLLLDVGNSAIKWRQVSPDGVYQGRLLHARDWHRGVDQLASAIESPSGEIYIASVAGRDQDVLLQQLISNRLGVRPQFCYSGELCLGVRSGYAQARKLGVDRWLAVIECFHLVGAAVVIDCGSAITLDGVTAEGEHLGGYIVPGLSMQEQALLGGTGAVEPGEMHVESLIPGISTESAVHHGIMLMSVAFIERAIVELRKVVRDTCPIYITGGDADEIRQHLSVKVEFCPDLVLDGLQRVVNSNSDLEK